MLPLIIPIYCTAFIFKCSLLFHEFYSSNFYGWLQDMNEPSNFEDGSETVCTTKKEDAGYALDHPPYTPSVNGRSLYHNTLCPSAMHFNDSHYNLHSTYGYFEGIVTNKCVDEHELHFSAVLYE